MSDVFDDEDRVRRAFHLLAESGVEITPDELTNRLRGFFLKIQDQLSTEGVWWSLDELVNYCSQPVVIAAIKSLILIRGSAGWQEFVDTITSLERGRFKP